jgi:hypothetical protein
MTPDEIRELLAKTLSYSTEIGWESVTHQGGVLAAACRLRPERPQGGAIEH